MARTRRGPPVLLDAARRSAVDFAIRDHCQHRAWRLHALHVRTNHVHLVVSAGLPPEQVMSQLKAWATRRMVEAKVLAQGIRPWSRHGSTRYLWTSASIHVACHYVLEAQGPPLPT
ncbi:MAG: transposase [Minicystis sp.]